MPALGRRAPLLPHAPGGKGSGAGRPERPAPVEHHPRGRCFLVSRQIGFAVRPEWKSRIPTVVHVDGTARPQIVRDRDNPLYGDILRRFRAATGLPALVNTSFNAHEEPIVNQPAECLRALRDRRVDFVVTEQSCYAL